MITTKFVKQYEGLVKSVVHEYEKDPSKFEDLVQDVWLRICEKSHLIPKDAQAHSTWVQVVTENFCANTIKKVGKEPELVLDSTLTPPTEDEDDQPTGSWIEQSVPSQQSAEDDQLLAELYARAATLSEQEAAVFNLVYWHGLSHAATAKKLGIEPSTVGVIVHRARAKLEVEELYHSAPTYHSPGTTRGDWSWDPNGEGNKRMGPSECVSRPDLVAAYNAGL